MELKVAEADAKRALATQASSGDGEPAAKRARLDAGTVLLSALIKEPTRPRTAPKETYQASWSKADASPPGGGKGKQGPFDFMVRTEWLRSYRDQGEDLDMQDGSGFTWWGTFEITDSMLLPGEVELLAEIPDSDVEVAAA